jgi:uncharacterized damage-inducible protein DinB
MEFRLEDANAILERTPGVLDHLLRGLPEEWARSDEGADTFSPFDVVGHLIHGEETDWIPRARIILEQGESRPFDPFDRWAQRERSREKSLGELLAEFELLRRRNLGELDRMALTPERLALRGTHPELGTVTLAQLLATWVTHDLGHLGQIARVMAKQYRREVGPWEAYIPILHR